MPMLEEFKASGLSDTHANRKAFALAYAAGHGDGFSAGLERAAEICDAQMEREAYGHAKHAVTMCADAIRAKVKGE